MLYPDFEELLSLKTRTAKDLRIGSSRSVITSSTGNHRSSFRGRGLDFDSVRQYVPGDDIRNIDWRVTARTNTPYLKIFSEERERQVLLCVDVNASMRFGTKSTFKSVQAARAAAYLAWRALASHDKVGVCLYGDVFGGIQFFPPMKSQKFVCQWLTILSQPPVQTHHVALPKALEHLSQVVRAGSVVFMISDFLEFEHSLSTQTALGKLKAKSDLFFISVNDPIDREMYPMGMIAFTANDQENIFVQTENLPGRKAYAAEWENNRVCLRQACTEWKIPLIEMQTQSDVCHDILMGLRRQGKRK